jgi:multidrug efflux pump subunit AcrA (membrane-fusion protein)
LFKLDIISDVDRLNIETEDKQADAKIKLYKARLNDCTIRAGFDGRVTKRLANEGDIPEQIGLARSRIADALHVEFLLPSKWLRWVNIGAHD